MQTSQDYSTPTGAQYRRDVRDGVLREQLVDVEIVSRVNNLQLGQHWTVGKGKHTIRVMRSDVPIIMAQVEKDPEDYKAAVRLFEAELDRACNEASERGDPRTGTELRNYFRATISSSPEAHYRLAFNRDRCPLDSARVLDGEYPPPEDEQSVSQARMLGTVIADALRSQAPASAKQAAR